MLSTSFGFGSRELTISQPISSYVSLNAVSSKSRSNEASNLPPGKHISPGYALSTELRILAMWKAVQCYRYILINSHMVCFTII
ncbi:hypothetical protein BpHYR1_012187 [Brachionus plicatilis]|uniref:Uncharacterized protein n=1 Tax=Brachionus plicatilis TaxID=10195 RepID=A0A3M7Q640_BRAPC|nr:hypothetical protein BpHYR1_012187 [Brachionus plicatilis]